MKGWKEKLKSNRGSSIIIALGLMMICAMISSVIVVAAAAGSSRSVQRVERQQAYLSVSSAAQVIMDELTQIQTKKYVGREEQKQYLCNFYYVDANKTTIEYFPPIGQIEGYKIPANEFSIAGAEDILMADTPHVNETSFTKSTYDAENMLEDTAEGSNEKVSLEFLVLEATEDIYVEGRNEYTEEFKITVNDTASRLVDVNCKFTMDSSYNMKWELTLDNSPFAYAMTINMKVYQLTVVPTSGYATENDTENACTHEVYYKLKDEGTGQYVSYREENVPLTHCVKNVRTTTITWQEPVLTKGVEVTS